MSKRKKPLRVAKGKGTFECPHCRSPMKPDALLACSTCLRDGCPECIPGGRFTECPECEGATDGKPAA